MKLSKETQIEMLNNFIPLVRTIYKDAFRDDYYLQCPIGEILEIRRDICLCLNIEEFDDAITDSEKPNNPEFSDIYEEQNYNISLGLPAHFPNIDSILIGKRQLIRLLEKTVEVYGIEYYLCRFHI